MLRFGDKGPEVESFQRALSALGYRLRPDGHYGPKTQAAADEFMRDRTKRQSPGWLVEAALHDATAPMAEPLPLEPSPAITAVGAWAGRWSISNPAEAVSFAVDHGINRLDVVVNDHSKWRRSRAFEMRDPRKIGRLVEAAAAADIETHLMSWIMPHERYIRGAAAALAPLCRDLPIESLQWDAEEPWTKARRPMDYRAAAELIDELFIELPCEMGVNGIGYTPVDKFGPLARICDYMVPQCYSTSTSGVKPEIAASRFVRRYLKEFGEREVIVGLAAYRQSGIPGHTIESAMEAAIDGVRDLGIQTVVYWYLRSIRANRRVARVVAGIRA